MGIWNNKRWGTQHGGRELQASATILRVTSYLDNLSTTQETYHLTGPPPPRSTEDPGSVANEATRHMCCTCTAAENPTMGNQLITTIAATAHHGRTTATQETHTLLLSVTKTETQCIAALGTAEGLPLWKPLHRPERAVGKTRLACKTSQERMTEMALLGALREILGGVLVDGARDWSKCGRYKILILLKGRASNGYKSKS